MFSVPPLSARKLHESYKKATGRRIFISPSTMAKSLGTLSKSFEISDKWLWIQCKNRIPLSQPVLLLSSTYGLVIPILIPTSGRGHRWPIEKSPSPEESKPAWMAVCRVLLSAKGRVGAAHATRWPRLRENLGEPWLGLACMFFDARTSLVVSGTQSESRALEQKVCTQVNKTRRRSRQFFMSHHCFGILTIARSLLTSGG